MGHEHEHVPADFLDYASELDAGVVRWLKRHKDIQAGVEPCFVGFQDRVGKVWPSSTDAAGAPEQMAQFRREHVVAGVDDVLDVADEMGGKTRGR